MSVTGATITVKVEDPRYGGGISGVTVSLYQEGAYVSGGTAYGTRVSGLTGTSVAVSGVSGRWGVTEIADVPPGVFTALVSGQGYPVQILTGYERLAVGPLITGDPDYLQMKDSTGGTWYGYVSTAGTWTITNTLI